MARWALRALAAPATLLTLMVTGASAPLDSWVSEAAYEAACHPYETEHSTEGNQHYANDTSTPVVPPRPESRVRIIVLCKTINR